MNKVCVVTGTRAEFGLLRYVMQELQDSEAFQLQIIATGMHLSSEFGMTLSEIEAAGFSVDHQVEMLLSTDTTTGVTKSMGLGMIGFADAFKALSPDLVLVLGDRFEIFSAVSAAMIARIPVAHLHGGEATEGLVDEAIRHSITKMSHLHFVATDEYRRRVIQLGELPERTFNVGGLGVDAIQRQDLMDRDRLAESLSIEFKDRNLLITFHPVTLETQSANHQIDALLEALDELSDTSLIFTMPNADADGRAIFDKISAYVEATPHAYAFTSVGQLRYLSLLNEVDGVVGNSSSGLTEAPSFGIGTINIGDRQKGRMAATSVIHCDPTKPAIKSALERLFSDPFKEIARSTRNPYGEGGASSAIVETLKSVPFDDLLKKPFYDLPGTQDLP